MLISVEILRVLDALWGRHDITRLCKHI